MFKVRGALGCAGVLLCAACHSQGASGPGDAGNQAAGMIDESVRLATLAASEPVVRANLQQPVAARNAALVAFYLQQPAIEAAGVSSAGNVWARFTDGTLLMHFDNKGDPPVRATGAVGPAATSGTTALTGMPGSVDAIAAYSLDPGKWTDVTSEISSWLTDAGYTPRTGGLTVDDLLAMSNIGVLFWQTHSGLGELKADAGLPLQPDGGPPVAFSFLTNTQPDDVIAAKYKALRDDGSLTLGAVMVDASDGGLEQKPRYGVTEKFISEKLAGKFAKNSLVATDSCTGIAAAAAWHTAGVAHFASWNDASGHQSALAFERFFDRLTGSNAAAPVSTPTERAFEARAVEQWMQAQGYDHDKSAFATGPSKAVLSFSNGAANGLFEELRPTVMRVLVTAPGAGSNLERFTIEGSFGEDPGPAARSVTYGGGPLNVAGWDAGSISVELPATPPSGNLRVTAGTHASEIVPITEWTIPFTYTFNGPETLQYVLTVSCRLRADVRGIRIQPGPSMLPATTSVTALQDSGGTLVASGVRHNANGTVAEQWSGGQSLAWLAPGTAPSGFVLCQGFFNSSQAALAAFVVSGTGVYTATGSGGGPRSGSIRGIQVPMPINMDWATLTINGDSLTADSAQLGSGNAATLSWPSVGPSNAPVSTDPR